MLNLSIEELKAVAKIRGIKGYKILPEDELLHALTSLKPVRKGEKPKINLSEPRIKKIRKEFNESRHKFSKSKINEIRRNLYEIENEKNLFESKIKEIEGNLTELEEILSKTKKYYDYDDIEYKGIRNLKDLFDLSIDEDYYKPIITKGAFNDMIKPHSSDIINDHKTWGKWRIHSGNKIMERKTQSGWEIQLTMTTNFISFKDSDETLTLY